MNDPRPGASVLVRATLSGKEPPPLPRGTPSTHCAAAAQVPLRPHPAPG